MYRIIKNRIHYFREAQSVRVEDTKTVCRAIPILVSRKCVRLSVRIWTNSEQTYSHKWQTIHFFKSFDGFYINFRWRRNTQASTQRPHNATCCDSQLTVNASMKKRREMRMNERKSGGYMTSLPESITTNGISFLFSIFSLFLAHSAHFFRLSFESVAYQFSCWSIRFNLIRSLWCLVLLLTHLFQTNIIWSQLFRYTPLIKLKTINETFISNMNANAQAHTSSGILCFASHIWSNKNSILKHTLRAETTIKHQNRLKFLILSISNIELLWKMEARRDVAFGRLAAHSEMAVATNIDFQWMNKKKKQMNWAKSGYFVWSLSGQWRV